MDEGNGHHERWGRTQLEGTRLDSITADRVDVSRSAVRSINAHSAALERSATQRMNAENVETERSAVASVRASTVTLQDSAAGMVLAQNAALDQANVFFLVSPVVRGNVRALVDLRAGFALGMGIVAGRLLLRLLRLPSGR
jgi:hypothetical protein